MANVVHSPIGFHARPVTHAPSPFGFGFGLSSSTISTGWSPSPAFANPSALHQFTSAMNQQHSPSISNTHTNTHNVPSASSSRLGKRRHDQEEQDDEPRGNTPSDQSMADRSPTPEKPRRIIPKRARMMDPGLANDKSKENKAPGGSGDDDVEVGLLLESLPTNSLLPLIRSLISNHPELKPVILKLIPNPTAEHAVSILDKAAKKLFDSYPYSTATGSAFGSHRSSTSGGGFGQRFGQSHTASTSGNSEAYIRNRLQGPVGEFVSTCMTYLPYFSYIPATSSLQDNSSSQAIASHLPASQQRDPMDTEHVLAALTRHVLSQAAITQSMLMPLLLPRLQQEWQAWANAVDQRFNGELKVIGEKTIKGWFHDLDSICGSRVDEAGRVMKGIRDKLIQDVGWAVRPSTQERMDE